MRAGSTQQQRDLVKQAFLVICGGWSPDRVVADPDLNQLFAEECSRIGLALGLREGNRILLNLRRAGRLRGLRSTKTNFANRDEYEFAAEIAIRMLERRDAVSLDDVICDPQRAAEFDRLCQQIAPGYSPLQYRWAALSLRKNKRLRPEPLARVVTADSVHRVKVGDIVIDNLPDAQAVYLFFCAARLLYVGETVDLRSRLRKHLDHSDSRELARWMWDNKDTAVFVEYHVIPKTTSSRVRKALELEFTRSRKPEFNVNR